jgi:hypothetical protein
MKRKRASALQLVEQLKHRAHLAASQPYEPPKPLKPTALIPVYVGIDINDIREQFLWRAGAVAHLRCIITRVQTLRPYADSSEHGLSVAIAASKLSAELQLQQSVER